MTHNKSGRKDVEELSSFSKNLIMMYDLASKEANVENAEHKKAFIKIVLLMDTFTTMAEMIFRMQQIELKTQEIINMGKALFK